MSRPRRYLLIVGLLVLAVLVALTWQLLQMFKVFETPAVNGPALDEWKAAPLAAPPPVGTDWPQYRGPNRDGIASADKFNTDWTAKPPAVAWKTPVAGKYGSVAIADGRVYVMGRDGGNERLVCLSATDGKVLWTDDSPADYGVLKGGYAEGPRATPTLHDGRAYTVGAVGKLRCVKLNGDAKPQLLWEHDLLTDYAADMGKMSWGFACSPLIEGDLVIVQPGGKKGAVVAFDRVSGEERWKVGDNLGGYSSPAAGTFGGVRQVIAVTGDSVVGIAVPDGKKLWEHPWKNEPFRVNAASPVVVGDAVFVSSEYGKGCALLRVDRAGVTQLFFKPGNGGMQTKHSTAVHRERFVYGANGAQLACMNLTTGTLVNEWEPPSAIDTPNVVLVGDTLLVQAKSGGLYLIAADPIECRVLGQVKLLGSDCWATPAVLDGRIYTRDGGNVVCIDARK